MWGGPINNSALIIGQSKPHVCSPRRLGSRAQCAFRANSVFGLPGYRGAQEEIVRHVTDGGNCLVLMPTGGGIEAILQHAHSLGAVIDASNEERQQFDASAGIASLSGPGRELITL